MSQAEIFKLGDVVQLKSGGPKMTVIGICGPFVDTMWFAGSEFEYLEKDQFQQETLKLVQEEPKK